MKRHLASRGFEQTLQDIAKAAALSDAPFIKADVPVEEARALWSQLFEVLMRLAALERAVKDAKCEIACNPSDFGELYGLKSERDALRRDLGAGTIWGDAASNMGASSLH